MGICSRFAVRSGQRGVRDACTTRLADAAEGFAATFLSRGFA